MAVAKNAFLETLAEPLMAGARSDFEDLGKRQVAGTASSPIRPAAGHTGAG